MSPTKTLLALTAALGLLGATAPAFAQAATTCTTDGDCQRGYTCQVTGVLGGTTPSCSTDTDCSATGAGGSAVRHDASDGGTTAPTVITISTCQPGPCASDSDCATGMICHAQILTSCSETKAATPCPADTKCDSSGSEPSCTNQTISTCTFKWALPCNADADCGDGFACQPSIGGFCSGSGGETDGGAGGESSGGKAGASGSVNGVELPADTCGTTMTYPGSCRPLVASCTTDADCPSNWVCQSQSTVVTNPGNAGTAGAGGATPSTHTGSPIEPASGAASSPAADVAPPLSANACVAPNSATAGLDTKDGAGGRTGSSSTSDPEAGAGSSGGTGGAPVAGTTQGGGSTGGTTETPAPSAGTTGSGGSTGTHAASDTKTADSSGGCSVLPAGGLPGAGFLAGVGLILATLVARRRRS